MTTTQSSKLLTIMLLGLVAPASAFTSLSVPFSENSPRTQLSSTFGPTPRDKPRREKKNKYRKSAPTKDPLELLMEESKIKMEELNNQKKKGPKNKRISTDEQEIESFKNQTRNFVFPDNKDIDPNDPASFGFIEIGTVVGPHGVHGEIKVKSSTYFPKRFTEPGVKFFKPYNKRAPRKVILVSGRQSKEDEFIVQLDETNNRDDAKQLRGGTLFVREEERELGTTESTTSTVTTEELTDDNLHAETKETEKEEFFISDLVGLDVFLESDSESDSSDNPFVGTVSGVVLGDDMCAIPGLAPDLLEVNVPKGKGSTMSLRDELVLIPFVPEIVPRVALSERSVFVTPPDGLLDLTYVREEKVRIKGFLPSAGD